jgi:hypothetical protein
VDNPSSLTLSESERLRKKAEQGENKMAKRKGTRSEPQEQTDATKGMEMDELLKRHRELCSGDVPQCRKTYMPQEFRGHVLLLIAESEAKAKAEEAESVSA